MIKHKVTLTVRAPAGANHDIAQRLVSMFGADAIEDLRVEQEPITVPPSVWPMGPASSES